AIGIVAVNGMLIVWTLAGLVLGAVYTRAGMPQFSIGVCVAALVLLGGAVFVRKRLTWPMWGAAAIAVLAFGAMLPALAALR
ncbi:MAG: diacylglycerol kinase, partial [Chloroflexi bacterium]|nr:diacylglycerol kinase [Chloroflexota bacterium]